MKRLKAFLCFLMAVVMSMSMLACTSGGEPEDATGSDGNSFGAGDGDIKLPELDIKSKVVVRYSNYSAIPAKGQKTPVIEMLKQNYGIEVQEVIAPYDSLYTKLAQLVMSDQSPDVFEGGNIYLGIKGLVDPLDGKIDYDSPLWKDMKDDSAFFRWKGKTYFAPISKTSVGDVFYNKKLFADNGVKTPRELYNEGKWNWDTLLEVAKAMTYDSDNDGVNDVFGIGGYRYYQSIINSTGCQFVQINQDGTAVSTLSDERMTRAQEFLAKVGSEKVIDMNMNQWDVHFKSGRVAMIFEGLWGMGKAPEMLKKGEIGFVPIPKDPKADKYYISSSYSGESIVAGAPHPDAALALINCQRMAQFDKVSIEQNRKARKDGGWTDEDLAFYNKAYNNDVTHLIETHTQLGNSLTGVIWTIMTQTTVGKPWATVRDQNTPILNALIDRAINEEVED